MDITISQKEENEYNFLFYLTTSYNYFPLCFYEREYL